MKVLGLSCCNEQAPEAPHQILWDLDHQSLRQVPPATKAFYASRLAASLRHWHLALGPLRLSNPRPGLDFRSPLLDASAAKALGDNFDCWRGTDPSVIGIGIGFGASMCLRGISAPTYFSI